MKSLLTPAIFLLAVAILLHTGLAPLSIALVTFAFYCALIAGMLLAWRFHSSRIFSGLLVLFLAQQAVTYFLSLPGGAGAANAVFMALGLLLPLDFGLISLQQEKGFVFASLTPAGIFLFVQAVIVAVFCRPGPAAAAQHAAHRATAPVVPFGALLAFAAGAGFLLIRHLLFRRPLESGLLWALAATFLALHFGGTGRIPTAYFATAAFILAGAVVETSYLLAYYDELTKLPLRRAFREALVRLEPPYSIAMADIDHFKQCNDTYGHDVGDQVLRLVASRLARVSGGGEAFRLGGEEFAIVFPGRTTADVAEPLEKLRAEIEASKLRLRGPDRRQQARGPDRRNERTRGRIQTGRAIRALARASAPATDEISVTISIGIGTSRGKNPSADEVIRTADKALYRAKAAGRNRVEAGSSTRRRAHTKTAGIA